MGETGTPRQWWVYDRPFVRDPMAWVALVAVGLAFALRIRAVGSEVDALAWVVLLVVDGASTVLAVGVVFGSIREYIRARRGTTASPEKVR
jgi:hypothetical protein